MCDPAGRGDVSRVAYFFFGAAATGSAGADAAVSDAYGPGSAQAGVSTGVARA